ncbi:hypothetical protein [Kaistella carnis]|uniref:DUF4252 domain-containing protein n=1 Tax=Kaistella carnis TaxID=1241979 RepID=A0A3G8XHW9_9FLAO|nr:hypothetical protein [Kaistella carnis]AZI32328.1 hypothetical protein EIB73_03630 [Kaistella carnis]
MKKLMLSAAALVLFCCSKEESKQEAKSGGLSDVVSNVKNYSKINSSVQDVSKNIETLKKMTPLTNEELKALLPEEILGLKRKELSVGDNAMMQLASAEAKYSDGDQKKIKLEIMDGAGETGSVMVSILMMSFNMNKEKITETGYEKTAEINGNKAIIKENSGENYVNSSIQMVAKNRYLITLTGDGISYDDLEKALNQLKLSQLK